MAEATPKEIRQAFEEDDVLWQPIREARHKDIKALGPDSTWSDKDRQDRKDAGRPCLAFDELGQYVNQLVNDARETKRAIEVNPSGDATSEHQAQFVSALIRQIEYRSNAQLAYTSMFEDAAQGSYGFLRIVPRYIDERIDQPSARSFEQELRIVPVPNAALITPGYFTMPDLSDCKRYWVDESYTHAEFKEAFGKAKMTKGGAFLSEVGPRWADANRLWVREFWELKTRRKKLVLLPNQQSPQNPKGEPSAVWVDTIPKEARDQVLSTALRERTVDVPYVCQTITNGAEILEKNEDWPGRHIPIVGCVGKVLWLKDERVILSLHRKALDPQQLLNYYKTSEAEEVGMTPKVPWFTYAGALNAINRAAMAVANQTPVGTIEVNPLPEGWNPAWGPVPVPQRPSYAPNIQAFEVGAESTRRSVQSATGTGFLPTEAQRQNEKSGVALREIATSAQKGAYHFVDHYEHAIRRVGELLVDLIPHYYDTDRVLQVRTLDDKPIAVHINSQEPAPQEFGGEPITTTTGEFDITLSTGPGWASEREKASDFADQFVNVRPETLAMYMDLIIELKQLGPIGDKMAKRAKAMLPPPIQQLEQGGQPLPPQAQQAMQQLQQAQQMIQQLQRMIETDQVKGQTQIQLKKLDGEIKLALEQLKGEQKRQQMGEQAAIDIDTREDEQAHDLALAGADAAQAEQAAEEAARRARDQQYLSGSQSPTV